MHKEALIKQINHAAVSSAEGPLTDNVAIKLHPLTRLKRRVFPESHSPTSSTALRTVLLVRKYFRKTERRKQGAIKQPCYLLTKNTQYI